MRDCGSAGRVASARMNKRLLKRHKRRVCRARQPVKVLKPDLKTPERAATAREPGRSLAGRRDALREPYVRVETT
jgi:hypothetical protein